MMVRELHHRVKNTLATVQAVLNATLRSYATLPDFTRAFCGRIDSLARTHALITEDASQAASFAGLLQGELDAYDENGRVILEGPMVVLPSELAVPVGMALHELTTNAVRHGALAVPTGRLRVRWGSRNARPVASSIGTGRNVAGRSRPVRAARASVPAC